MSNYPSRGNYAAVTGGRGFGTHSPSRRSPFGLIYIAGKAGEKIRVFSQEMFLRSDSTNQGVFVQAFGGSVDVKITLAPADIAADPAQDAQTWVADTIATPGSIKKLTVPVVSAVLLTFTADALISIVAA